MGSIFVAEITYETSTLINDIFNKNSSPPAITSPFTESPLSFGTERLNISFPFYAHICLKPREKATRDAEPQTPE